MIATGDGPAIDCPFELCHETVRLVIEQERPDDDEGTIKRVPLHDLVSRWSMPRATCPASLLQVPLSETAELHLEQAAEAFHRATAEARESEPQRGSGDRPEHSKTPHPVKGNGWFTQGGSPAPDEPRTTPVVRPRLKVIGGTDRPDATAHLPKGDSTVSDNARERLQALALLSAEKTDLAAEVAVTILEKIRELGVLAEVCGMHLGAAETLARSAVGSGSTIPTTAGVMVAEVAAARTSLNNSRTAMGQVTRLASLVTAHANNSASNARTYAGSF